MATEEQWGIWKERQFLSLKRSLPVLLKGRWRGGSSQSWRLQGALFPDLGHSDINTRAIVSWASASGGMLERTVKQMAVVLGRRVRVSLSPGTRRTQPLQVAFPGPQPGCHISHASTGRLGLSLVWLWRWPGQSRGSRQNPPPPGPGASPGRSKRRPQKLIIKFALDTELRRRIM